MIQVALLGAGGKTGSHVRNLIQHRYSDKLTVSHLITRSSSAEELNQCDGVIDFSSPAACLGFMKISSPRLFWVVGSTGWTESELHELQKLSENRLILKSSNFSLGVTLLNEWLKLSSPLLRHWGFDVTLSETHHVHKKDTPSGTALTFKNTLTSSGFSQIPLASKREGNVVGEHTIHFTSDHETIILTHSAKDRSVFAQGAIEAAQWLTKLKQENPNEVGIKTLILQQN